MKKKPCDKSAQIHIQKSIGLIVLLSLISLNGVFSQSSHNLDLDSKKNNWGLHISLPHINNFSLKPPIEQVRKVNTGFWGFEIGVDYFYSNNSFLTLSGSANSDFFIPVPASPSFESEYEVMSSIYLTFLNNKEYEKWTLGYGITYGRNTWRFINNTEKTGILLKESVTESYNVIGVQAQAFYRLKNNFYTGIIYRPTYIRTGPNLTNEYEHFIVQSLIGNSLTRKKLTNQLG